MLPNNSVFKNVSNVCIFSFVYFCFKLLYELFFVLFVILNKNSFFFSFGIFAPKQQINQKSFFFKHLKLLNLKIENLEDDNVWKSLDLNSYFGKALLKFLFRIFFVFRLFSDLIKFLLPLLERILKLRFFHRIFLKNKSNYSLRFITIISITNLTKLLDFFFYMESLMLVKRLNVKLQRNSKNYQL